MQVDDSARADEQAVVVDGTIEEPETLVVADGEHAGEDPTEIIEVDPLSVDLATLDSVTLRRPNEVYHQIYQAAKVKAKLAKKVAIEAYLEARKIKNTYLLDDIGSSSDEEFSEAIDMVN